jgi:hypothetical protein
VAAGQPGGGGAAEDDSLATDRPMADSWDDTPGVAAAAAAVVGAAGGGSGWAGQVASAARCLHALALGGALEEAATCVVYAHVQGTLERLAEGRVPGGAGGGGGGGGC